MLAQAFYRTNSWVKLALTVWGQSHSPELNTSSVCPEAGRDLDVGSGGAMCGQGVLLLERSPEDARGS